MKKAPIGVGWGTTNIPKEKWIDVKKSYQTRTGKNIISLNIVLANSCGNEVTFPVKGSIDMGPRREPRYCIWTLDGKADVFSDGFEADDLVEIKA